MFAVFADKQPYVKGFTYTISTLSVYIQYNGCSWEFNTMKSTKIENL